jgi:hypothetical protein
MDSFLRRGLEDHDRRGSDDSFDIRFECSLVDARGPAVVVRVDDQSFQVTPAFLSSLARLAARQWKVVSHVSPLPSQLFQGQLYGSHGGFSFEPLHARMRAREFAPHGLLQGRERGKRAA